MYLPSRTYRTLIMGRKGAVGTNHPLATQAGPDALADDGGFYGGCACATPTGLAPLSTLLLPGLGLLLTLRRRRAG